MSRRAYTLVELVLVAGLMTLVAGIALPSFSRFLVLEPTSVAANDLALLLRSFSVQAVRTRTPQRISIDCVRRTLRAAAWVRPPREDGRWVEVPLPSFARAIPSSVSVLATSASRSGIPTAEPAEVVLNPDLGNGGLLVEFRGPAGASTVMLHPVTARVVVSFRVRSGPR